MKRSISVKRPQVWFLALALLALALGPSLAWGESLKVCQPNQCLYPDANFAGTPLDSVPEGEAVNVLKQEGDWYKVEYKGKEGWMNRQAFPTPSGGSKFSLPGMLFGSPVKETSSDEAALAGKGFTPEVEASYKQKHPEMKFAEVDKVESYKVDPAKLQAFIKEGGLTP